MRVLEKIIDSVLASSILSLALVLWEYILVSDQQAMNGYFSFSGLFIICFIISFPVHLIGGSLYSFLVDVYYVKRQFRSKSLKYIIECLIYLAGGVLVMGLAFIISFIFSGGFLGFKVYPMLMLGALSSLIFFHISLVVKKMLKIDMSKG